MYLVGEISITSLHTVRMHLLRVTIVVIIVSTLGNVCCAEPNDISSEQRELFAKCEEGGKPEERIRACNSAINSKLFHALQLAALHGNRAAAFEANGDTDSALKDYNRALELAPANAGVYYNRGVLFASSHELNRAIQDYDSALRIDPSFVPALFNRGAVFSAKGDFKSAVSDFSEAIRFAPTQSTLYARRGFAYFEQHDFVHAVTDENQAIQLTPEYALAHFIRAMAYGGMGDGDKASADIQVAIKSDPSLARYMKIDGPHVTLAVPDSFRLIPAK